LPDLIVLEKGDYINDEWFERHYDLELVELLLKYGKLIDLGDEDGHIGNRAKDLENVEIDLAKSCIKELLRQCAIGQHKENNVDVYQIFSNYDSNYITKAQYEFIKKIKEAKK
jgi:hypothetical protein